MATTTCTFPARILRTEAEEALDSEKDLCKLAAWNAYRANARSYKQRWPLICEAMAKARDTLCGHIRMELDEEWNAAVCKIEVASRNRENDMAGVMECLDEYFAVYESAMRRSI